MAASDERRCNACGGTAHEIHMIDKTGVNIEADLEYTLPEAKQSFFLRKYPKAGKILGFLCSGCGQITFYGQPE